MRQWSFFMLALIACLGIPQVLLAQDTLAASALPCPVYPRFADLAPRLAANNDTTYVVNFWATWCAPCVKELPYFEALHQRFKDEKVKVLLVSIDFKKDLPTKLRAFLAKNALQAEVVALVDGQQQTWIDAVDASWSGAIPATLLYRGRKRQFFEGEFADATALEAAVTAFRAE